MVDNLDQTERVDRELNVVKRARFNQTIETRETNEVPEPKFGVEPHTVKELPALPVRERQHENMLLHQQLQDNMLEEEVVSFGQRAQHQQEQQQLQLRQHNIPHNPVSPKQFDVSKHHQINQRLDVFNRAAEDTSYLKLGTTQVKLGFYMPNHHGSNCHFWNV